MLRAAAVLALVVDGWLLLLALARRLPPGLARDLATFLPDCVALVRRLRRDRRVPGRVRLVVAIAGLWVLSPIDLVPEFLPVIGPLDDVVVVVLALRYALRHIPREVLHEALPTGSGLLARLAGEDGKGTTGR